jgi:hypothetical protein
VAEDRTLVSGCAHIFGLISHTRDVLVRRVSWREKVQKWVETVEQVAQVEQKGWPKINVVAAEMVAAAAVHGD